MRLRKLDSILARPFRTYVELTEISVLAKISIHQGAGAASPLQLQEPRDDVE